MEACLSITLQYAVDVSKKKIRICPHAAIAYDSTPFEFGDIMK